MDEGAELDRLRHWLGNASPADEPAIVDGLSRIAPALWPSFSGQAAADLDLAQQTGRIDAHEAMIKRRLLGEERRRREYPVHGDAQRAV